MGVVEAEHVLITQNYGDGHFKGLDERRNFQKHRYSIIKILLIVRAWVFLPIRAQRMRKKF